MCTHVQNKPRFSWNVTPGCSQNTTTGISSHVKIHAVTACYWLQEQNMTASIHQQHAQNPKYDIKDKNRVKKMEETHRTVHDCIFSLHVVKQCKSTALHSFTAQFSSNWTTKWYLRPSFKIDPRNWFVGNGGWTCSITTDYLTIRRWSLLVLKVDI